MFVLTAFDTGNEDIALPSLESSFVQGAKRTIPGTQATNDKEPGVYPNPFVLSAAWDGSTQRTHKINFYNLPAKAEIQIFTVGGDLVASLNHNSSEANNGASIGWYSTFGSDGLSQASGEHSWDVLSANKQSIATGLYLYTVKNLDTGVVKTGKFAIVK